MEGRGIRDHLNMIRVVEIRIRDGNRRSVGDRYGLRKRRAEIRILRAAVADEPAGVDVQMHKIGEAAEILRPRGLASLQSAELVEIHGLRALAFEICVDKSGVADFVDGVAGYVLRTIAVQIRKRGLIRIQGF